LIENGFSKQITDPLSEFKVIMNLSKQTLKWRLMESRESNSKWTDYEAWLKSKYPETIVGRDEVVSFIEQTGLDTKEKQKIPHSAP
jgi:hypothetical protein